MIFNHKAISGTTTAQALSPAAGSDSTKIYTVERLMVCNVDTSPSAIDLYLYDGSTTYYILDGVDIPAGQTLDVFNGIPFKYEAKYALYIKTPDPTDAVHVIFNQY